MGLWPLEWGWDCVRFWAEGVTASADLSFNNIEVVQGLEKLHCLRDLSLAHNRIRSLDHTLSTLPRLQVLSLGCNLLEGLDQVRAFREYPALQSLTLRGNPLASETGYPGFVMAYVPSLVYLDFCMVMEPEVRDGCH